MANLDFSAPADLFPARSRIGHRPVGYRRFATVAEAIQYAIEKMPAEFLDGTVLEVDGRRLSGQDIRRIYDSEAYPLARKPA